MVKWGLVPAVLVIALPGGALAGQGSSKVDFARDVLAAPDPRAETFMAAIRDGAAATARKRLAREPAVVNLRGLGGSTPLMYAALYGDLKSMRVLLDAGADPNAKNYAGATALMWA